MMYKNSVVSVVADDRERSAAVMRHFAASEGVSLGVERLPVGDYRVDDRFLFERKTLPDLAASIASGRLFSQALRLVEVEALRPAVILEGTSADWRGSGMRREAVQGALVTLTLFFALPVLRTRSAEETVNVFLYAARQWRTAGFQGMRRPGRRPRDRRAVQRRILESLPGVGPARAERLLERFGSVRAVLAADERALAEVEGVGERIAGKIEWAVKETAAGYI